MGDSLYEFDERIIEFQKFNHVAIRDDVDRQLEQTTPVLVDDGLLF
jgi:hypothetical protein